MIHQMEELFNAEADLEEKSTAFRRMVGECSPEEFWKFLTEGPPIYGLEDSHEILSILASKISENLSNMPCDAEVREQAAEILQLWFGEMLSPRPVKVVATGWATVSDASSGSG